MNKLYKIISGKKSFHIFILFSFIYSIILAIFYLFMTMPLISKTEFMNINALNKNNEIVELNNTLTKQKEILSLSKNNLNTKMGLFLNDQEIEEFYEEISNISLKKQMIMKSLIRGETILIDDDNNKSDVQQYKVSVAYELEGSFANYLSIRKELANLAKVIIFENESITRAKNNSIIAIGEISVPRMEFKGGE
jgi:hypothetical protein